MKQELISLLQLNCLLPRWAMVTWINNLVFQNEPSDALRQLIIDQLKSNGQLKAEGWQLLIDNVSYIDNPSITPVIAQSWIPCPTCNQLKEFINNFKLSNNFPLVVQTPILDLLDVNMIVGSDFQTNARVDIVEFGTGSNAQEVEVKSKLFTLQIRNFHLIKDASPYLIIERYTGAKRATGRKAGWKRDRTLKNLGGTYLNGWQNQHQQITDTNGYRPNEIPITTAKQTFDIRPMNYIYLPIGNKYIPVVVSGNSNAVAFDGRHSQHVNLRLRIGYKVNDVEKKSKPLIYFSIFAQAREANGNKQVFVSYSKI